MKVTRGEKALAALVAVLGLIGFGLSFENVASALEPSFGRLSPAVPIGIDVGIAAFTWTDLAMARRNMRTRWLRLVPWGLVGVTVFLNVAREPDLYGKVAHGVMPLLFVVLVEVGAHVIRVLADLAGEGQHRMDRVRVSRWLLAPWSTLRLWRRMVLWETRSYPKALEMEQARLLALCDLQDNNGGPIRWRWRAPRRERVLYRLGQLTPDRAPADPPPATSTPALNGDRDAAARETVAEGYTTRRPFMDRMKQRGYGMGTATATKLLERML